MKNLISILIFQLVLINFYFAQINLVPNGGFELGNSGATPGCYSYYSGGGSCGGVANNSNCQDRFNDDVSNWNVANRNENLIGCIGDCYGSPDWIDPQTCPPPSPCPQGPSRYVHMSSESENLRVGLQKNGQSYKLIPGKKYIFEIRVCLVSDGGGIRLFFTKWGEHWNSDSHNNQKWGAIDGNIHYEWNSTEANNAYCEWIFYRRTIQVPNSSDYNDLENMVLLLEDNYSSGQYTRVLVDDVALYEYEECQDTRYIQDRIYWNESGLYQAGSYLISGNDVTSYPYDPTGDVIVKYNSRIYYRAGQRITLEPGFNTENGAYFETFIEPCDETPCDNTPPVGQNFQVCGTSPIIIGPTSSEIDPTSQYSWTPTTYLDDPNIPNPTFTPPPNGLGKITYTLTVTPACGGFITSGFPPTVEESADVNYNVTYVSNPDPNPSFTLGSTEITNCSFDISIDLNPNTEFVYVQVENLSTGQMSQQQSYFIDPNSASTVFNWSSSTLPQSFWDTYQACHNYVIHISTSNFCYPNNIYTQDYFWGHNTTYSLNTPLANVITPNGDGVNDWFVLDADGVNKYSLYIYNRLGRNVYRDLYVGYCQQSFSGKLWAGQCNMSGLACTSPCLTNGDYYYVLYVYPCTGGRIDYNGVIQLTPGTNAPNNYCQGLSMKTSQQDVQRNDPYLDSLSFAKLVSSSFLTNNGITNNDDFDQIIGVYPNPSNGVFNIEISQELLQKVTRISILDANGKTVYVKQSDFHQKEILNKHFAKGIYLIKIDLDDRIIYKKMSIIDNI